MSQGRLEVRNLGPIPEARLEFGDLTVFTGPQASGKSVALQLLKLVLDEGIIREMLLEHGLVWKTDSRDFLDIYFGEGMRSLWKRGTLVEWNGTKYPLRRVTRRTNPERSGDEDADARTPDAETAAYIPAQRVMSLRDGFTRPFGDYRAGDPFVLREFSHRVHEIVQNELTRGTQRLFPKPQRFNRSLRGLVSTGVFGGWELSVDTSGMAKEFVLAAPKAAVELEDEDNAPLKFLAWSAGQREFVPLLLGMYRLMPAGRIQRRDKLSWAIIEEPESGLHPKAIAGMMAFVFELLRRGYRVAISTHSTHVLDVVWGLRNIAKHGGSPRDAAEMIADSGHRDLVDAAGAALRADRRVYYFERSKPVTDISDLDPFAESLSEAGWGGLTSFSERVSEIVSRVVQGNSPLFRE